MNSKNMVRAIVIAIALTGIRSLHAMEKEPSGACEYREYITNGNALRFEFLESIAQMNKQLDEYHNKKSSDSDHPHLATIHQKFHETNSRLKAGSRAHGPWEDVTEKMNQLGQRLGLYHVCSPELTPVDLPKGINARLLKAIRDCFLCFVTPD